MTTPHSQERKTFRVNVETADVVAFRAAMARADYVTADTGERIMTEAGPDAETVLLVTVPREACVTRSERVAALLTP